MVEYGSLRLISFITFGVTYADMVPFLLTWINFIPIVDK